MTFLVVYVSGDHRRVHMLELEAVDIDTAAAAAIDQLPRLGPASAWFVAGVVQQNHVNAVCAALEGEL